MKIQSVLPYIQTVSPTVVFEGNGGSSVDRLSETIKREEQEKTTSAHSKRDKFLSWIANLALICPFLIRRWKK